MAGRGRPPKGVERSNILLRMPTDLIEQVDAFKESLEAERGGFVINRTDMLIRLIEVGLQTLTQARQPAPASHVNGQGTSAPQPTTQPAIPLALEPAPKTAHPVDVPQAAETPVLAEIAQLATEVLTVSAEMAAVLADEEEEEMPQPAPAEPVPARAPDDHTGVQDSARQTDIPPYDATKYMLGKLCPQRHEWGTTGQSRLTINDRVCPECRNALKRRKRAEKRQGQPA